MSIDLRPYGLNWTLDVAKPDDYVPKEVMPSLANATLTNGNKVTFALFDGTEKSFTMSEELGHGSFGAAYKVAEQIDGVDVVVKSIKHEAREEEFKDAVIEFLIQLICAEETKDDEFDGISGPFVPRVYYIGKNDQNIYLVSERMDMTLQKALQGDPKTKLPPNRTLSFLRDAIVQIAKILDILERKDRYSHRDFKTDNIMIKTINGRPCIKLIDFGFSCLDYKGIHFNSDPVRLFKKCDVPSRDMSSLFYNILAYEYLNEHDRQTCPIVRIMLALLDRFPEDWSEQYKYYNRGPVIENMTPGVIYDVFKNMQIKSDNECSPIGPGWVKYVPNPTLRFVSQLTPQEQDMLTSKQMTLLGKVVNINIDKLCEVAASVFDSAEITKALAANDSPEKLNGVCKQDGMEGSPIHVAAASLNPEFIQQLLQRQFVKTMVFDNSKYTPLHKVARSSIYYHADDEDAKVRYLATARLLLDRNPSLAIAKTREGKTAAEMTDKVELQKLIKSYQTKWWQAKPKNTNQAGGTRKRKRQTRKRNTRKRV